MIISEEFAKSMTIKQIIATVIKQSEIIETQRKEIELLRMTIDKECDSPDVFSHGGNNE